MLIFEMHSVGNKLLALRKKRGMTQAETAEAAGLSDRAYADIERGAVTMRIDTLLRICDALGITPNDILTDDSNSIAILQEELFERLKACCPKDRKTALSILSVFLNAIE